MWLLRVVCVQESPRASREAPSLIARTSSRAVDTSLTQDLRGGLAACKDTSKPKQLGHAFAPTAPRRKSWH